ncbi:MAG: YraN family protein [Terriglobales bacterium]
MLPARFTQTTLRALDWLSEKFLPPDQTAEHLKTGRRGEEEAYFYLRRRDYTIIARNYRSPNHRGELDLVGWVRDKDGHDVLCFIEVKTRTSRAIQPAEAAVDRDKEDDLRRVAFDFLRHLPESHRQSPQPAHPSQPAIEFRGVQCRGDVLAVYYDRGFSHPTFELFQNAFSLSYNRGPERRY